MTDDERFLADLEAKAKAATPGPWKKGIAISRGYGVTAILDNDGNTIADMEHSHFTENEEEFNAAFIAAANPSAVLQLVGMVRWLADNLQRHTCPNQSLSCEVGCPQCVISAAYVATENHHD